MSTTEITTTEAGTVALPAIDERGTAMIMRAVEQMAGAHQLATALSTTAFVPAHFRGKPDDVAAAIMYGAAIGLDPMSSLRAIYVVSGTPGLYARQMVAIVQAAGHEVWTEQSTDTAVTVCGRRRGSEHVERVTWTPERAKRAGYTSNKKYDTDPQAMLWARAASDVARRVAPDALAGLDTSVEELQVIEAVDVTPGRRRESVADLLAATEPARAPEPVEAAVVEPDAPEPLTDRTRKHLFALLHEQGIEDREQQIAGIVAVIGRPIASRSELTEDEGRAVIIALEARAAADAGQGQP